MGKRILVLKVSFPEPFEIRNVLEMVETAKDVANANIVDSGIIRDRGR